MRDTKHHSEKESDDSSIPRLTNIFKDTTWRNNNLGSVTQAGLINNLNDGMVWGLFPLLLSTRGFTLQDVGLITAIYPGVWGLGQLFTGKMADHFSKKLMLFWGMFLQGIALLFFIWAGSFFHYSILSALLGLGTAMVYPTFLASISENVHPQDRPKSIGTFRLWRDLGYAVGAILTGIISDAFNINTAIVFVGLLTIISSVVILIRMTEKRGISSR